VTSTILSVEVTVQDFIGISAIAAAADATLTLPPLPDIPLDVGIEILLCN
jgi:hypothetical protein